MFFFCWNIPGSAEISCLGYQSVSQSWDRMIMGISYQYDHDILSGWWFGTWLLFFHNIWDVILPIDFHIFQRGRSTTNQYLYIWGGGSPFFVQVIAIFMVPSTRCPSIHCFIMLPVEMARTGLFIMSIATPKKIEQRKLSRIYIYFKWDLTFTYPFFGMTLPVEHLPPVPRNHEAVIAYFNTLKLDVSDARSRAVSRWRHGGARAQRCPMTPKMMGRSWNLDNMMDLIWWHMM